MNKTIIFLAGVAVGGVVGWWYAKSKYEAIAQQELMEKRAEKENERRAQKTPEGSKTQIAEDYINPRKLAKESMEKPGIMDYANIINKAGYKDYTNGGVEVVKDSQPKEKEAEPYSIPKDQVGSLDYDRVILTWYADEVLADEQDEVVDVAATVGEGFDDYIKDDEVFIRNDKLETDYEIYVDERSYSEVSGNKSR